MQKIAQVCHNYLPHIGGIEMYVNRLVKDLTAADMRCSVLTTDFETDIMSRKPEARYFSSLITFMRNPFSLSMLRYFIRNEFDLLHLHSMWFLPSLMAVIFRKGAALVTTVHGASPENASPLLRYFLWLYNPVARYILKSSDIVIALSENEKQKIIQRFGISDTKIHVIPNGIDLCDWRPAERENTILFTGRIIADKNPDLLLKAFASKRDRLSDHRLVMIGPANENYLSYLKDLACTLGIRDQVDFRKPLDQTIAKEKNELLSLYQRSRVFVALGSWEGLPTRILEAMQYETPCISYSSGGVSDLIIDGYNGVLISKLDCGMLAEKLEAVLLNENFRDMLGRNARATVVKDYDWKKIFRKILNLYRSVIAD